MKNPYEVLEIPHDEKGADLGKIISNLELEYQALEEKDKLTEREQKSKNFIKKILEAYDQRGEDKNESILNFYMQYRYQQMKAKCETEKEKKEVLEALNKISTKDRRNRINKNNKRTEFANILRNKVEKTGVTAEKKRQEFYQKYPTVQAKIKQTHYLKGLNCIWKIEEYPNSIKVLDYDSPQSKCHTKAEALGKMKVKIMDKKEKNYWKQESFLDIVKVEKREENGVTINYVVLMDLPKREEVELKVQEGKIEKMGVIQKNPIPIKEEELYADGIFSYEMLESTKNNYSYLGQIHKILGTKWNMKDEDIKDGMIKEILAKASKQQGIYQMKGLKKVERVPVLPTSLKKLQQGTLYAGKGEKSK